MNFRKKKFSLSALGDNFKQTLKPTLKTAVVLFLSMALFSCNKDDDNGPSKTTFPGEVVAVPGGLFSMGSTVGFSSEKPVHNISVGNFSISKYEITNAQYATFMNNVGADASGKLNATLYLNINSDYVEINYINGNFAAHSGKENLPVVEVSWHGAKAYCEYYGGRLPTEAEWEYAAKGGAGSNGFTYSGSSTIGDVAWHDGNSGDSTHTVGTKSANELGLYDMTGNVWEWCSDWYNDDYYANSPANDPQGPATGTTRVNRGGSWIDDANNCRVAKRYNDFPEESNDFLGFRPVFIP